MTLDENDRMGLADAAAALAKRKGWTVEQARRGLVAALICGETAALSDALWTTAVVQGQQPLRDDKIRESVVPTDFWRIEHARALERAYQVPTGGSWGDWSRSSFQTVAYMSCNAARQYYPEFMGDYSAGSDVVSIVWNALDVTLHRIDVERLCARTDWRNIRERANRANSNPQGRNSKQLAVYAAFAAGLVPAERLTDFIEDPRLVARALDLVLSEISADQGVASGALEKFASLFNEAAWSRLAGEGPPTDGN